MKKILSLLLAMLLVIGLLPVMAVAEIKGKDENSNNITVSPVEGNAKYVFADAAGDDLTVTGNVTGDDNARDSVYAASSAKVTVSESVTKTGDSSDFAVRANTGDVSVKKDVTESGNGDAIYTSNDGKVFVGGNISESGAGSAIQAYFGSSVEVTGNVTENGDGNAIQANGASTQTGAAATVTVNGSVTENDAGDAIKATNGAAVEVGSVSEDGDGDAIKATDGTASTVTVNGDVTEKGDGHAIEVKGSGTITVKGSVTEEDDGNAIYAQNGATVIVYCDVTADGSSAISAQSGATVIVGGNVTDNGGTGNDVSVNGTNTKVIIEGTVTVDGYVGATNSGELYLGKLERAGKGIGGTDNIHYLIGVAPEGSAALSAVTLVSDIVADGTIDGVNEKGYKYTSTADADALNGKTIILKPADGKILTVSGFDGADVTYVANEDGTVTFTIGDSFTGGLQNLVLTVTDKQVPEEPVRRHENTTIVTIGNRDDKEETKAEETVEENPDTGAPVMDLGVVAVVLGAAYVVFKKH